MKNRIIFFLKYFVFWISILLLFRLVFVLYHIDKFHQARFWDFILIFIYGLKLDLSLAAYLAVIPVLSFILLSWVKNHLDYKIIRIYTILFVLIVTLLYIIDLELYNHWLYRLDNTFLEYIDTPGEMLANLKWHHYFIIIGALFVSYFLFCVLLFNSLCPDFERKTDKRDWLSSGIFLFILVGLIIPMRGGLGTSTLNVGAVYFHKEIIVNHAAINPVWNLVYSLTEKEGMSYEVEFFSNERELALLDRFNVEKGNTKRILKTNRPNLIFIILESFTAQVLERNGGKPEVAPNFNRLIQEGVYFENFYASGDASAKGLGAIIAGYPSLPSSFLIKFENKVENTPGVGKELVELGYTNKFYYGGDIDFAHIRSFLIHNRFDNIVSIRDFPSSDRISSWGVPDHIVFNRLLEETNSAKAPFCHAFFTLSSHAPYDVPMEPVFKGKTKIDDIFNSIHYTDKALGQFINDAKRQPWWDSTLIILVADHGASIEDITLYDRIKFHIPMLMLGGAVNVNDTIISKYGNQTDIPATLYSQMDLNYDQYNFSRDLLSDDSLSYTFYTYHKGIGYLDDTSHIVYDLTSSQYIAEQGIVDETKKNTVKALLQNLLHDFTNR